MSQTGAAGRVRFLTFEVGDTAYALPISDVLEVADVARIAAVPALSRDVGGVMNLHGEALPVVTRRALFGADAAALSEPKHMLVIAGGPGQTGRVGFPVDRVLGLADGERPSADGGDLVVARFPVEGRVIEILGTERLVAHAADVVARSAGSSTNSDLEDEGVRHESPNAAGR